MIAIPQVTALTLRSHRERIEHEYADRGVRFDPDGQVCARPDGRLMKPFTLSHAFKRTARRLGLGEFRFHDLRHTHASLLLSVGTPPHVVQSRLGHQTSQITLDIYGHVLPQSDVDAGATIADLIDVGRMWADEE